jgi:NADH:ubiquinone oxidoreductase subunit 5 (subunit L)/multisubunit Na+/H+ antiporter MnhA subunit
MFLIGGFFVLLFGWELIRIISFVLISWWWRFDALAGSIAAVLYNRFGDLALIIWIVNFSLSWFSISLLILAILGKSSQSLQSYWLPMAMEGPTPVSSLLHSSTMVVAGVMFSLMIGWVWLLGIFGFLSLLFVSLLSLSFYDVKKIVAFSTSCHLSLILCIVCFSPSLLLLHIMTHGFVKGSVFIVSGAWIHFVGSQDLRLFSVFRLYHINMFMLMGFGVGFVHNSKEFVLFGSDMLILVFVLYVIVSLRYSSTVGKHGSSIRFGSFRLLINVMFISIMILSGFFSFTLMDFGWNWVLLCFVLFLIPVISDMNSRRFVHKT